MAKVYCFIALLFCCLQVAAQADALAKKDTVKKKHGQSFEELKKDLAKNNPLYLLNGSDIRDSISKEDFEKLKSEDITSFDVIKSDGESIWGKRGANGVVIVHTKDEVKNLIMANGSGNQPITPLPSYSATRSISSIKAKFPLYIIDGKLLPDSLSDTKEKVLKTIDPDGIFSISALDGAQAIARYGPKAANSVFIITTKTYAVRQYQDKLAGFSKSYGDYLERKSRDDSNLVYVVDGKKLTGTRIETIGILYNLRIKKIKEVTFRDLNKPAGDTAPTLTINTKQ